MKLQFVEEPPLAFHQNQLHVDIRAGLSTFGAFDKGSDEVPVPIRIGVIGTTATQADCAIGSNGARTVLVRMRRS